ncbi:MAG: hypothetical protein V4662_12245 [Verrucomicrobiota bacterium]
MRNFSFARTLAVLGATLLQTSALFGVVDISPGGQPPGIITVADGKKITLSVTATSSAGKSLFYTWKKRGAGASVSILKLDGPKDYVIASAKATDAGNYFVTVREADTNDEEDSTDSVVVVNVRPKIVTQPVAPTAPLAEAANVSFSVAVDSAATPDFTYTLQKKQGTVFVDLAAPAPVSKPGRDCTLQVDAVDLADQGSYRIKVTNPATDLPGSLPVYTREVAVKVNSKPVVLTNPAANFIVTHAATGVLKVVMGGNIPMYYQWYKNDVLIPKAIAATLTIKGTDNTGPGIAEGPGVYHVKVVNQYSAGFTNPKTPFVGSTPTVSANSTVVVIRKPKIATQPAKETIDIMGGGVPRQLTVANEVVVGGNHGVLQYQWFKDGKIMSVLPPNITGATTTTLAFNPVTWNDRGSYKVVIKNEVGTVTSTSAVLTIISPPIILTQSPPNVFAQTKGTAKLFVTATGTTPLVYEWRFLKAADAVGMDETQIKAALALPATPIVGKAAALSISGLTNGTPSFDQGYYQCTVKNAPKGFATGSDLSDLIYLQVDDGPKITKQTTILPYETGAKATPKIPYNKKLHLQVMVTGTDRAADEGTLKSNPQTVRWLKNGVALVAGPGVVMNKTLAAGVITYELIIQPTAATDTGKYALEVSNLVSKVTSTVVSITSSGPPIITVQPAAVTGIEESKIETFVTATNGSPLLTYSWEKKSGDLWAVLGKTAAKLTFLSAAQNDGGIYRCKVSNDYGDTYSAEVIVTVTPIPSPTLEPVPGLSAVELYPSVARTGDKVRIYGQNLNYVKTVKFGVADATFVIESANAIVVTVPPAVSTTPAPISVSTKNPVPTDTDTLFRRTDEYENILSNTTIVTQTSGTVNISGDNRYVQQTYNSFFGDVYYELFLPTPTQVQVYLQCLSIESGLPADLDMQAYRETQTGTSFVGANGVTRYPSRATTFSAYAGNDALVISTSQPNQRILINVYGGFAVTQVGYVDFGPFTLTVVPVSLSGGSNVQQPTLTRLDAGWETGGKSGLNKLDPQEDDTDEDVRMQFGGTDITSAEPVVIWQQTEGASSATGSVIASFDMSLESGTAGGDDQFAWQVSGADGSPLAALWVNAADGSLRVVQADGTVTTSTQHITPGGGAHRFEITVDPVARTWITIMDGVPVTDPVALPAGSSYGEISAVWDLGADQTASGASIIFENFRVEGVVTTP